ncbi:hypothetical protein FG386_003041 [Cryptosporidium ryanae]|uniref:uncharacterized protein n=1 Tax=Cryptosporidium ryanae TaxID=515981 RepID=UPI00351A6ED3|nr:hypothetical protein FG386_003041 [Cryptosporidium ryanae]
MNIVGIEELNREEEFEEFPDIHDVLLQYNDLYFYGSLGSVVIKWSKRMTLCAGRCTYEPGGRCVVSLSEPILKYRTVKELRETILHELIHAYLFVTLNNRDRTSHGPEFCYHMNRINALTGLNITIYHSFHEEVNYYRKYVWRCNGVCRNKPPHYGFIRRSVNREPNRNDFWWAQHKSTCGGKFIKQKVRSGAEENVDTEPAGIRDCLDLESKDDVLEIIEIGD